MSHASHHFSNPFLLTNQSHWKNKTIIMQIYSSSIFIPAIAPRTVVAKNTPLAPDFLPGPYDVVCSRGKAAFNHIGNRRFRFMISNHVEKYNKCKSKVDKSLVVIEIVDMIRELSPNGGFCKKTHTYVDVGDNLAREKVGHALREALNGKRAPMSTKKSTASTESPKSIGSAEIANSACGKPQPVLSLNPQNSTLGAMFAQALQSENGVVNMEELSEPAVFDVRVGDCVVEI